MSIFTCCEREDETKYIHPCGCPSAIFICESEEFNSTLCGLSEYTGFASSPPIKYTREDQTQYLTAWSSWPASGCGSVSSSIYKQLTITSVNCSSTVNTNAPLLVEWGDCSTVQRFKSSLGKNITSGFEWNYTDPGNGNWWTSTLSVPDTEALARARATAVTGTSCSSLWETRGTGFSFIDRTSGYKIECSNLAIGFEYEVIPSIRKRTAVTGSDGAWEDVTVSSTSFTATATTETIDSSGNPIALDHIQGYEYAITGVNIEKKT